MADAKSGIENGARYRADINAGKTRKAPTNKSTHRA